MFLNFWISYVEVIECVSSILFEISNGAFQKELKLKTVTPSNGVNANGPFNAELTIINVMVLKWVDHNAYHLGALPSRVPQNIQTITYLFLDSIIS